MESRLRKGTSALQQRQPEWAGEKSRKNPKGGSPKKKKRFTKTGLASVQKKEENRTGKKKRPVNSIRESQ